MSRILLGLFVIVAAGWADVKASQGAAGGPADSGQLSEIIPLKYASARDVAGALNGLGTRRWAGALSESAHERLDGNIRQLGERTVLVNEPYNSLLVTASAADMRTIRAVIAELDVTIPQLLIEAVILGFPAKDATKARFDLPSSKALTNVGALLITKLEASKVRSRILVQSRYLATLGTDIDAAIAVLATGRARVLQRPRVQTSLGEAAHLWIGFSPPASANYGAAYTCGCTGYSLDVTCLLSQAGMLLMQIDVQEEQTIGIVNITNVGDVPITTNYDSQVQVAIQEGQAFMLGGMINMVKTPVFSEVPQLDRIPWMGDPMNRLIAYPKHTTFHELVVLIRVTLLPAPKAPDHNRNPMPTVRNAPTGSLLMKTQ